MAEIEIEAGVDAMLNQDKGLNLKNFGRRSGDGVFVKKNQPPNDPLRDRIVVIIPAYNEERFIGSVALKAFKYASTVIVVDDGSSDCTAEVAAASGALVVRHSKNQGKGAALSTGFRLIRDYHPEAVVVMDADGQHLPEELSQVVEPILSGQADIVVGSRYLEHTSEVPRHRIWGHRVFNLLTRVSSGMAATDSQSGFRAFSPAALERIDFRSHGFSVESEMQFIAKEYGLRLVEVPITIRYTDKPKRPVVGHGLGVLNGVLRMMGQYRPLLFFGVPGLFLLISGILWGFWVVEIYRRAHTLAVGYAMLSVLLTIIGMLSLSTGIILHSIRGLLMDFIHRQENS
jgi:glycosyltransferase involved in cell wall biosynthesis